MVHIVQRGHSAPPYGTGLAAGNVYYAWPGWMPRIGINVIKLPVSNFDLTLEDYATYDTDRVPFVVHVISFFRIADTALAAQRVASIEDLREQLMQIVQGAVRKGCLHPDCQRLALPGRCFELVVPAGASGAAG